ncbi:hypothetical protein IQ07DRAFT_525438 [Pyrenochaeta sp. DS3sAY3a]|nr:hypothetical protein IQ07DRAFT_525438 [Pyrenochaeta sp. DS3sAY3a]
MSALLEHCDDSIFDQESPENPERGQPTPKRTRTFIARHACEICRRKKSRCDEEFPCGQCRRSGRVCQYGRRRRTRNEDNATVVLDALQRLEARLDQAVRPVAVVPEASISATQVEATNIENEQPDQHHSEQGVPDAQYFATPLTTSDDVLEPMVPCQIQETPISFGGYSMLFWPAVQALLPPNALSVIKTLEPDLPLQLETRRSPLVPTLSQQRSECDKDWLSQLTVATVKRLCDAFLSTMNLSYPVIEREFFFQHTLSVAISEGFEYNIESCLVLVVMALGCAASKSLRKRDEMVADGAVDASARSIQGIDDDPPGLGFFNEARRRIGFVTCDGNVQSCQYYLLAGIFYANLTRPMESWAMIRRASVCSTVHLETAIHRSVNFSEWEQDMHSRLYWIVWMLESVVTAEFDMANTKLPELKDQVKLPQFVAHKYSRSSSFTPPRQSEEEPGYHYHFLSQAAHRIMLSRIHNTLYHSNTRGRYPAEALEEELYHQLRAWRDQLPLGLRFDDQSPIMQAGDPATILVTCWLPARYYMARYHIGRPRLHRLLHYPETVTETDIEKCGMIVNDMVAWLPCAQLALHMHECLPLKFTICCHILGQLVLVQCIRRSPITALRHSLPGGISKFSTDCLDILNKIAPESPTVATYAKIGAHILAEMSDDQ